MKADADLSPRAFPEIINGFLAALGLSDVTLVGSDTGGALCQYTIDADAGATAWRAFIASSQGQTRRAGQWSSRRLHAGPRDSYASPARSAEVRPAVLGKEQQQVVASRTSK
jgi:pimeloyl-ACP methyl ester carboxylesterase